MIMLTQDIRGNKFQDGDLALKIVDMGSNATQLCYCVVIKGHPYYKKYGGITSYKRQKEESIVKVMDVTETEKEIRRDLLQGIANEAPNSVMLTKSTIERAQELCAICYNETT